MLLWCAGFPLTIKFHLQVSEKLAKAKKASLNEELHISNEDTEVVSESQSPSSSSPHGSGTDIQKGHTLKAQRDKMKVLFQKIDTNNDGRINKEEFRAFEGEIGLTMKKEESDFIFDVIDNDGSGFIEFNEFYNYFVKFVMGETSASKSEAQLRSAFLSADRDGSGSISFTEFAEVAMSQGQELAMTQLMQAFKEMDKDNDGTVATKEFHNYVNQGGKLVFDIVAEEQREPVLEDLLGNMYSKTDATEMAQLMCKRWDAYADFKRTGDKEVLVMKGGPGMVDDVYPGEYALIHLALVNELPPIETEHAVVEVTWKSSDTPGKSGTLVFPENFNVELPTVIATNQTLAYYGASLADGNKSKVSLFYRHGVQDFTYENNYLDGYVLAESALGGAGIEKHEFTHLDCPLDDDSGRFILGKLVGNELHLTAFKVPTRETLYVPPNTIHSNDYLRGTWRTMLSDEATIDHVQLMKPKGDIHEHFHFTFKALK